MLLSTIVLQMDWMDLMVGSPGGVTYRSESTLHWKWYYCNTSIWLSVITYKTCRWQNGLIFGKYQPTTVKYSLNIQENLSNMKIVRQFIQSNFVCHHHYWTRLSGMTRVGKLWLAPFLISRWGEIVIMMVMVMMMKMIIVILCSMVIMAMMMRIWPKLQQQ